MWLIENFINPGPTKLTLLAILLREGINTEHQKYYPTTHHNFSFKAINLIRQLYIFNLLNKWQSFNSTH